MFFAIFLELYSNSRYNKGRGVSAIIRYQFAYPQVLTIYQEYLIYDGIGMIGSVGGSLGMFIGFSFSNAISSILNCLLLKVNIKRNLEQP